MKKVLFVLVILLFGACERPKPQVEFFGDEQFRMTPPSLLYFKNVRSSHYYKKQEPHSKMDIYTLRKLSKTDDRPVLYPKIISNWLKDESYLFVETGFYPYFPDTLRVRWQSDTTNGEFVLDRKTRQRQYEFAGKLYNAIMEKQAMQLLNSKKEWVPILNDYEDKAGYVTVLRDYYKLTEVY